MQLNSLFISTMNLFLDRILRTDLSLFGIVFQMLCTSSITNRHRQTGIRSVQKQTVINMLCMETTLGNFAVGLA